MSRVNLDKWAKETLFSCDFCGRVAMVDPLQKEEIRGKIFAEARVPRYWLETDDYGYPGDPVLHFCSPGCEQAYGYYAHIEVLSSNDE